MSTYFNSFNVTILTKSVEVLHSRDRNLQLKKFILERKVTLQLFVYSIEIYRKR